jgi:drug/metabolite transporter (DMT)-like permease
VVLVVNAATFVPLALLFGDEPAAIEPFTVTAFLGASVFGILLGRAAHFEGIRRIGASRAEAIKASQPLHASLIAVIILSETVTAGHLIAMVAIVAGIALISLEYRDESDADVTSLVDLGVAFAAALFYGLEPTFVSLGLGTGSSIWTGLAIMSVGGVTGVSVLLLLRGKFPARETFDRRNLAWFLAAGGFNTAFLVTYYSALQTAPVSVVVPLLQMSPMVVIVLSALFVRNDLERVTWRLVSSALVVVAGAAGVTVLNSA